jgi:hypothetical protein
VRFYNIKKPEQKDALIKQATARPLENQSAGKLNQQGYFKNCMIRKVNWRYISEI